MSAFYEGERVTLLLGDCVALMRELPAESVDAIVCDPPYGLEFMGKDWDAPWEQDSHVGARMSHGWSGREMADGYDQLPAPTFEKRSNVRCRTCHRWRLSSTPCSCEAPDFPNLRLANMQAFGQWCEVWALEALRVLKPGGHLAAFGGPRTYHRLAAGVEDAGFELRDSLMWLYGSGFPKSMDVSRAIDSANGDARSLTRPGVVQRDGFGNWDTGSSGDRPRYDAPASAASAAWDGWGTALKPAYEPIVLARKPLAGTVAATVLAHGTGALNIDATRIEGQKDWPESRGYSRHDPAASPVKETQATAAPVAGRWPANVLMDAEAAALLDGQTGESTSRIGKPRGAASGDGWGMTATGAEYADRGGASRFFYTAKASRDEREAGVDVEAALRADADSRDTDAPGSNNPRLRVNERRNDHPTVKPLDVMRWLCRLVTPPGGVILDPFLGSGTTALAALDEGFTCIGMEQEPRYLAIARDRITHRHLLEPRAAEPSVEREQGRLL